MLSEKSLLLIIILSVFILFINTVPLEDYDLENQGSEEATTKRFKKKYCRRKKKIENKEDESKKLPCPSEIVKTYKNDESKENRRRAYRTTALHNPKTYSTNYPNIEPKNDHIPKTYETDYPTNEPKNDHNPKTYKTYYPIIEPKNDDNLNTYKTEYPNIEPKNDYKPKTYETNYRTIEPKNDHNPKNYETKYRSTHQKYYQTPKTFETNYPTKEIKTDSLDIPDNDLVTIVSNYNYQNVAGLNGYVSQSPEAMGNKKEDTPKYSKSDRVENHLTRNKYNKEQVTPASTASKAIEARLKSNNLQNDLIRLTSGLSV